MLGYTPSRRDHDFLRRIALVMGNRRMLAWDLPALDSYELRRSIYSIPTPRFRATRDELVEGFDIGTLVTKPVRNLSLGERMKVELVGALLHEPELLFLDEPTLGLDVSTQLKLRSFVADYSRRTGATVLLTSHYMADVQALAERRAGDRRRRAGLRRTARPAHPTRRHDPDPERHADGSSRPVRVRRRRQCRRPERRAARRTRRDRVDHRPVDELRSTSWT